MCCFTDFLVLPVRRLLRRRDKAWLPHGETWVVKFGRASPVPDVIVMDLWAAKLGKLKASIDTKVL